MIETKLNTWPQGVIWGHTGGVSSEMGHCRGAVTGISTCTGSISAGERDLCHCGSMQPLSDTQTASAGKPTS